MAVRTAPGFSHPRAIRVWLVAIVWMLFLATGWTAELQKLHGHRPAATARLAAVGWLDGATQVNLAVALPLRNQPALGTLLRDLYNPASPNYRKFLTPAQFATQFGPTDADYQAVVGFAKAHGLTVTAIHPNRVILDVKGAVADIEKALHVTLRTYNHPTEARQFFAPDAEPSLDLAVPIAHISGLDNYAPPQPRIVRRPAVQHNNGAPSGQTDNALPNAGSGPSGGYMGKDFRAAYVPGTTLTGAGQTIGLLQFDGYTTSDITYYENAAGLPNVTLTNVLLDGFSGTPTGKGGEVEVSLDIEMSISMAPGLSNIIVYEAGPSGLWHDVLNRMATDNLAQQLSCSWYIPGGTEDTVADGIFQQMAAQGQSFYSASGDVDAYSGLIPFPGDTPYITEVGGTTLTTSSAGGPWSSETVWNRGSDVGGGGGISTQYSIPSWQQGISMAANQGSTTMRNVPDVALTAENVYVRADGVDQNIGGTSCATPLWAGFTALVNQQAVINNRPPVGFINPAIYTIGTSASYNSDFNDTVTGNNFSSSSPTKFVAATGYDLCTGWGTPNGNGLIAALAGPPDGLLVSGPDLTTVGPVGGPFNPASTTDTLNNTGASPLNWTISSSQPWITVSPAAGTLAPNASTTVTVSQNSAANSLGVGSYSATLTVADTTGGVSQFRRASLAVLGPPSLTVTPSGSFTSQGNAGGPFSPASATYTITNTGAPSMNWTVSNSSNWLSLSSSGGTLAAGASATVTASLATPANALGLGNYNDSINFVNTSNGAGNTAIGATLNVTTAVMVPQPPQTTTSTGDVRGYWFTAPATFVITGLEVPTDASTGAQTIAVLKLPSAPPAFPSTTNNFTTAFLTQNNPASGVIPVNILVNQGDLIGILGYRAEVNSYGSSPFSTQILGQSVTLTRFGMQFPLDTSPPQSVWGDTSSPYLSRVNMYVTGSNVDTLSSLVLSAGTLTPAFSSGTASYGASVSDAVSAVTVTPTLTDSNATVQVNGVLVASGTASAPVNLAIGPNAINMVVTAQDGSTRQTYTVTVTRDDTVITTQSGTQAEPAGQAASFSVSVTGTGPFTYQWYKDGALIPGATSSSYSISSIGSGDAGTYWVIVTNVYGATTSNTYTLTVGPGVPAMPPWGLAVLPALLFVVVARALSKRPPIAG